MDKQDIYDQIIDTVGSFTINHDKTTKVSDTRARKDASALVKLLKEYRKASLGATE